MSINPDREAFLVCCSPKLAGKAKEWLDWLANERRMSAKTLDAYEFAELCPDIAAIRHSRS